MTEEIIVLSACLIGLRCLAGFRNGLLVREGAERILQPAVLVMCGMVVFSAIALLQIRLIPQRFNTPLPTAFFAVAIVCGLLLHLIALRVIPAFNGFVNDYRVWTAFEFAFVFLAVTSAGWLANVVAVLCVYPAWVAQKTAFNLTLGEAATVPTRGQLSAAAISLIALVALPFFLK
jgi:hypothetical protein